MERLKKKFPFAPEQLEALKQRMLHWANRCNILLFLDSNQYRHTYGRYECLLAVHAVETLSRLFTEPPPVKDWWFGHISYDFKNQLEQLHSGHPQHFSFPDLLFFRPAIVCYIPRDEDVLYIETTEEDPQTIWEDIQGTAIVEVPVSTTNISFSKRLDQQQYLERLALIREHIRNGDCYELNFCNEAFCTDALIDPLAAFRRLNTLSPAPFAAYYRLDDQYLLCAAPERYLYLKDQTIIAQPIKGTSPRGATPEEDEQYKQFLRNSLKERAEHVMIADLMRNDLARFCVPGSINVEELYGIYSFPRVHQMISTISGRVAASFHWAQAMADSFPMGSMTGAPKIIVMQLIEKYEAARRSLFSGTVGYISPDGDFDFNVVIRSLFYNAGSRYLSYQTGGAITWHSDPLMEWEETLLKAAALEQVFR